MIRKIIPETDENIHRFGLAVCGRPPEKYLPLGVRKDTANRSIMGEVEGGIPKSMKQGIKRGMA
jgi:hypothetical protein